MELAANITATCSLIIIVLVVGIVIDKAHPLLQYGIHRFATKFLTTNLDTRNKRTINIMLFGLFLGILSIWLR